MTWENYGKWHIDHIKPCANFNLSNDDEQKLCFHYTNMQPLWAIDNQRKWKN
jgi:DNA/RNA endonuclease G (NUC1)